MREIARDIQIEGIEKFGRYLVNMQLLYMIIMIPKIVRN